MFVIVWHKLNKNMPLSIGEGGALAWQRLAVVNEHPRDLRIQFNEEEHSYAIDGVKAGWSSCTQFIHKFFGHFDPDVVIPKMMRGRDWYKNPLYGKTTEEIKAIWAASGAEASSAGTRMHLDIEHFYNSAYFEKLWGNVKKQFAIPNTDSAESITSMKKADDWDPKASPEWDMFIAYQEKIGSKMIPFRTEWLVFNEDIKVAGSIDMLYKKANGKYAIYDWKRAKDIKMENRYQAGLGPLCHLPDTNYWIYSMQLNVYRMILKQKYDMDIEELALVILHPNNPNWRVIKINIMEQEVLDMFDCRKRALAVKGNDGTDPVVVFEGTMDAEAEDGEHDAEPVYKGWVGLD